MEYKEINYKAFGKCIAITDGVIELYATVDIGPRIIRFSKVGGENMLGENCEFDKNEPTNETYSVFGDNGIWHNFGGHRLWASPEKLPRTYFPDNKPCRYEIKENTLYLYQIPQPYTQLELSMEITLMGNGEVEVCHKIKNTGAWEVELAPWAISVMAKGGVCVIPVLQDGPALLPNRFMSFWTYSRFTDKRFHMNDRYLYLEQTDDPHPFKIGCANPQGFAAYFNNSDLFCKYFGYDEDAIYPDNGMNFETYTNKEILEIESLGALEILPPDASVLHAERWKLVPNVEFPGFEDDKIEEIVLNNL